MVYPPPPPPRRRRCPAALQGRPGASMAAMNLQGLYNQLEDKYAAFHITKRDVLSAALYPKVRAGSRGGGVTGVSARATPRRGGGGSQA